MSQRKGRGKSAAEKMKDKMDKGEDVEVTFVNRKPSGTNKRNWITWLGCFVREVMDCDLTWKDVPATVKEDWWTQIKVQS